MNHYLKASDLAFTAESPEIFDLIQKFWDAGPLSRIAVEIARLDPERVVMARRARLRSGWAFRARTKICKTLSRSRQFICEHRDGEENPMAEGGTETFIPQDLLGGPLSRHVKVEPLGKFGGKADFIVQTPQIRPCARGDGR